jgi:UDP-glucose 4-epimerase
MMRTVRRQASACAILKSGSVVTLTSIAGSDWSYFTNRAANLQQTFLPNEVAIMILITGGMGFIGLHLAKALLKAGESVVLTRYRNHRVPEFIAEFVGTRLFIESVDVLDIESLRAAGRKHAVTGIAHLASPPMRGPVTDGLRDNSHGLLNVLQAGKELEVHRVLLASSIAIYAGVQAESWKEDEPLPLASPYPMTAYKKQFETIGDYFAAQTGLSVVSARITAYGPLARGLYFLPARAVHAAVKGVPCPDSASSGPQPYAEDTMDFAYVTDTAEAMAALQLAPALSHTVYNIGGGWSWTNREIAEAVRKAVPEADIRLQPGRSSQPAFPSLDLSRLKADIGWEPRYTLETGIAEYVSWLQAGHPF